LHRHAEDFIRASKIAAKIDLSPELVHFIFVLFDNDGDGELNYNEFVALMKDARTRGLNRVCRCSCECTSSTDADVFMQERDLGAARGVKALVQCAKMQLADRQAADS
jgi:hypothetical protein